MILVRAAAVKNTSTVVENNLITNAIKITKEHQDILDFINETKEGMYTDVKPDLAHITYSRLVIPDVEVMSVPEDEMILYGISY